MIVSNFLIKIDSKSAGRKRRIFLNHRNAFFRNLYAGTENWATPISLIDIYELNSAEPYAYATGTPIRSGYSQVIIEFWMPWH